MIFCSEWVPSEWESKKHHNNQQVINMTPVHLVNANLQKLSNYNLVADILVGQLDQPLD